MALLPETFFAVDSELVFRLILAVLLGGLIGVERQMVHKPAGLRTHMLVALGAALFTIGSLTFVEPGSDPSRIASNIVTGIGFLGAGSIIAMRGHIHGITTAATLWIAAAVGLGAGLGAYSLTIIAAVIVFFILRIKGIEDKLADKRRAKNKEGWYY